MEIVVSFAEDSSSDQHEVMFGNKTPVLKQVSKHPQRHRSAADIHTDMMVTTYFKFVQL